MTTPLNFDAGNLALDLLNTDVRYGKQGRDDLQSPGALLSWLDGAGILPEGQRRRLAASPPDARMLLAEAHRLRHEVRAAVAAMVEGRPPTQATLTTLNRLLGMRATTLKLVREAGELLLVESAEAESTTAVLAPVAEAAAHLLVGGAHHRIRQCHDDGCGCWFVDTSKNGRRKWCSMARCGNRAKVAAHHRRHRSH